MTSRDCRAFAGGLVLVPLFAWGSVGISPSEGREIGALAQAKPDEPEKAPSSSADVMRGKEPGEIRDDNGLKLKLVWCPPGKFKMGSPDTDKDRQTNEDQAEVTLTNGFSLGQTEVTQGQWEKVMGSTPWKEKRYVKEGADYPATYVSWENAMEFCRKLTDQERSAGRLPKGYEYTLPTEAQWEYACRTGTTTRYSFGDDASPLSEYAWWGAFSRDGNTTTEEYAHRVGLKKPNQWGLHDMHGNVFEWCLDWREARGIGETDAFDPLSGRQPVYRGGSWTYDARSCRAAYRRRSSPTYHSYIVGFRVAASVSADRPDG
jgi:sulfatase modifying factor 1